MDNWEQIHASALVIDAHADTPQRFLDEAWNFSDPLGPGHLNLASARRGNLAAEFFAIWAEPHEWLGRYALRSRQLIAATLDQIHQHPNDLALALTPDDILRNHASGLFSILLGIEGGHSIENSLDRLREFHALGVRYMTLTWANSNDWADSSGDLLDPAIPHHNGLTAFGRDVVREMNRLGMMVDVSHVSDKTFWDVVETSEAPILASHSSARAITNSPRNLTDDQLRAVAASNGVVMVNFYPSFIDDNWRTLWAATLPQREPLYEAAAALYRKRGQPLPYGVPLDVDRNFYAAHCRHQFPLAPFDSLLDHFDHIAKVAGIDHLGIGSDFDGFALLPAEIANAADLPKITAGLARRGYSAEDLRKLLGHNLLRVFEAVQTKAANITPLNPENSP